MLQIENLSVDFISGSGRTSAVRNVSLRVNRGEIVALVGESGSGKSVTSLSILQLLPAPPVKYVGGRILFSQEGKTIDLLQLPEKEMQSIRGNRIAMIFQEPMTSLNPVMTCGSQITEALRQHQGLTRTRARMQAIAWMERVRLPQPEKLFDRYPHQLSGGQKQRIMIAMAMCCEPSLLICDEPTTALDVTVQKSILETIRSLQQEQDMGVLFITHDLGVVAELASRVALMYKGEILEQDSVHNIFSHPAHPYTKALLACRPALHPKGQPLPVVSDFWGKDKAEASLQPAASEPQKPPSTTLISVENLRVSFPAQTNFWGKTVQEYRAVDDVSFHILQGETLGLVGESGCGKTTLGRTLLGLTRPSKGKINFRGKDIANLSSGELKPFRLEVQLVFQDPYSALNPRLTIEDAIGEPLQVNGCINNKTERKNRVAALLEKVGLPASAARKYPHEFSGGQRQRIVIARALALQPDFLVCDESVAALDVSVQAQVLNLLNDLKKKLGLTLLFISHDLSVVRYMSDRILVMQKGKIVESGPSEILYNHPQSAYTRELLAAIPGRKNG